MTTDTDIERLARVLWTQWHRDSDLDPSEMEDVWQQDKPEFLLMVKAILAEQAAIRQEQR